MTWDKLQTTIPSEFIYIQAGKPAHIEMYSGENPLAELDWQLWKWTVAERHEGWEEL